MRTKPARDLTLADRFSQLSPNEAKLLLGPRSKELLSQGGTFDFDLDQEIAIDDTRFVATVGGVEVTIDLADDARKKLRVRCSTCTDPCVHAGAAVAFVLEEKTALGLAAPPPEHLPLERLSQTQLVERALAERAERSRVERMTVRSQNPATPWVDYVVRNAASGKSYRVALRGREPGVSFCTCPDFKKNTLGTCKHLMRVLAHVQRRFDAKALAKPYVRTRASLSLSHGTDTELRLSLPDRADAALTRVLAPFAARKITKPRALLAALAAADDLGHPVKVYPDAEEYLHQRLLQDRLTRVAKHILAQPATHPLRRGLLEVELLPYQLAGVAFIASAGRAILADEMGLGKTIQAIGAAELLAREAGIRRVLVICPASVKAQWRAEIERFCARSVQLVLGSARERAEQYRHGAFFTVCNYEQVLRDVLPIEQVPWDLIVLDEAQRIKNWEAQTSRVLKGLRSPFALAMSGTPLENRLEELYSVVEFVDDRRLAPMFRFFHRHRLVDEHGRVLGYTNLDELRQTVAPVLLRRTRAMVMRELPPRSTELLRIPPTDEQVQLHGAHMRIVGSILRKRFLTEMDVLRLRKALLMARMCADSTFLVGKQRPSDSSKLERLRALLDDLLAERDRKIVLFSEWTTMLDEIEALLTARRVAFLRLDGSVPQGKRAKIVGTFQRDARVKLLLMTNAGAVGLNLQAANTVINVDLPWNPAVLEQRIGRVHRMGQKRPVQVYLLVTEDTIEENLLATLGKKQDLAVAALDTESSVDQVEMASSTDDLRHRLEVLLGAKQDAAVDESQRAATVRAQAEALRRAFAPSLVDLPNGQVELRLAMPDRAAFERLVDAMAEVLASGKERVTRSGDASAL